MAVALSFAAAIQDLQQNSLKEAKTVRQELLWKLLWAYLCHCSASCPSVLQEYDLALDSLGNLIEDVARRVARAVQRFEDRPKFCDLQLYPNCYKA